MEYYVLVIIIIIDKIYKKEENKIKIYNEIEFK